MRKLPNGQLLEMYGIELKLRLANTKDLSDHRAMLKRFIEYLGSYPPSEQLGKSFLSQYVDRKPRTLARYGKMIGGFLKWYGESWEYRVRIPKDLPTYTEQGDIDKLRYAITHKKTHRGCIVRDALLVDLALTTGLRRAELADLEPRDIHSDFLVVRSGKGQRDRVVPLVPTIAKRLNDFKLGLGATEKVLKLKAPWDSHSR